jgi:hypothetical protein
MMMKRPSGSSARAVAMARVPRSNAASSLTRAAVFAAKPASQVTVTGLLPNAVPGLFNSAESDRLAATPDAELRGSNS